MSEALPTQIGKYRVESALGEGGFGRVYKAFDPTVGRLLAIKVLTTRKNPEMLLRFQNEANAAGNLHHINIVTIYEYGTFEDSPFIAMEYLEGEDLNQMMYGRRSLTILDKVRIMTQVGEGLQYAHEHGVIHRDVKPPNIKVQPNGAVKILDFGIARMTDNDSHRLTQQGDLLGSIRYMSPEQFTGGDVSELSDIFAYGVVFYELLAGVHPFDAADAPALMYRISECKPKPLSDVLPRCPPLLNQIVMRALEKDQDVRYQSLEDLLLEMRPLLNEYQKAKAAEIVLRTRELFEQGQIQKAQAGIREAIELDSSNAEAWELREKIQVAAHRKSVRPKVEALLKTAEDGLSAQQFQEAIESLESAARLDPTNILVQDQLKAARRLWEAAREGARLVAEAKKEFEAQNLTLAERLATQAMEVDARNPEASGILKAIRRENERREKERRLRQVLDSAQRLVKLEDYDSAIEQLEAARELPDAGGAIPALLARVLDLKKEQARQERLRSEKQALRGVLKESRFRDALPRLETLCAQFPEDADLAALLADTRQQLALQERSSEFRRVTSEVGRLRAANNFSEAEATLRSLCTAFPTDTEAAAMLRDLERAHREHARRQTVGGALRAAEKLRGEKRFEEAKLALDAALREVPDEPELVAVRKKLEAEWAVHQQSERSRRAMSAAQEQISAGKLDAAIALLESAVAEDPHNGALGHMLRDTSRRLEQERISRAVDRVCSEARGFADAREFDAAIETLRRALRSYPEDGRLEGLLDALTRQKAEWEGQQRLTEMIRTCTQLIRERRYPEAIFQLTVQLKKQPGEATLLKLREQASAEWESIKRTEALNRALTDIRGAIGKGQFLEAQLWLKHYQNEYSSDAAFIAACTAAENAIRKHERGLLVGEHLNAIGACEAKGEPEGALKAAEAAAAELPDEPQFTAHIARLRQEIERQRKESHAARLNQAVRQAIENRDWTSASKQLENFGAQVPKHPAIAELRELMQRERRRVDGARALEEAERSIARRDWAAAEGALSTASAALPESGAPAELKARIAAGRKRDQAFGEAQKAFQKGRWLEAERRLEAIVQANAADSEAAALLVDTRNRRVAEEAQQAIAAGLKDAARAAKDRAYESAIEILEPLISRYGTNPDLERARQQALAGIGRTAEAAKLAAALRGAIERQDFEGAGRQLDDLARRFAEEAPVAALRDALQSARNAAADEVLRQAEAAAARGDWAAAERFSGDSGKLAEEGPRHAAVRERIATGRQRDGALQKAKEALQKERYGEVEQLLGGLKADLKADPEAAAIFAEVGKRRAAVEAAQAVGAGLAAAGKSIQERQFEAALTTLDALATRYGPNPEVEKLRKQAAAGIARKTEAARLAGLVRQSIERRELDAAQRQLDDVAKRFSDAVPVVDLRRELDAARRSVAEESLRQAGESVARGDWAAAERSIAASLKMAAESPLHAELRARIAQGRQREAALREAELALQKGKTQQAEKLLAELKDDAKAAALLAEARRQRAAAEASAEIAAGIARAEKAIAERQLDAAAMTIDALAAKYGTTPELEALRKQVAETKQEIAAALQEAAALRQRIDDEQRTVADGLREGSNAIAAGQFEAAARIIGPLIARHGSTTELDAIRKQIDDARSAVADGIKRASKAIAERQYDAAGKALAPLIAQYGGTAELEALRKQIADAKAAIADGIKRASTAVAERQYDAAAKTLEPLIAQYGSTTELDAIRKQIADARAAIAAGVKSVAKLVGEREYDAAEKALAPLIAQYGGTAELEAPRKQIADAKAAIADGIKRASKAVAERQYDAAAKTIEELIAQYGSTAEFDAIRKQIDDARAAIAAGVKSVAKLVGERKYDAAEQALAPLIAQYGSTAELVALRKQIADAKAAIADGIKRASKAVAERQYDAAAKALEPLIAQYGSTPEFDAIRKQIAEAKQTIAEGLKAATKAIGDRHFDAAARMLEPLVARYGSAPELESAQRQIAEGRQRQNAAAAMAAKAQDAIGKRNWKAAASQIDELATRYPEAAQAATLRDALRAARQSAGGQALAEANAAVERTDWAAATLAVNAAQEATPDAPGYAALRARIDQGTKVDGALREARKALEKSRFEDAEKLLKPLVEAQPAEKQAEELWHQAQHQRADAERAQAIAQGLKRAERLSKEKQYDRAAALLADLITGQGSHPDLERELKKAQKAATAPQKTVSGLPLWRQPRVLGIAGVAVVILLFLIFQATTGKKGTTPTQQTPTAAVIPPPTQQAGATGAKETPPPVPPTTATRENQPEKAVKERNIPPPPKRPDPRLAQIRQALQQSDYALAESLAPQINDPESKAEADRLLTEARARREEAAKQKAAVREPEKTATPVCPPLSVNSTAPALYNGANTRPITWNGFELAAGCSVVLQGGKASVGSFTGLDYIPAEDATIEVVGRDIAMVEAPRADNGYRIVLRNASDHPIGTIAFRWKRAQVR